VNCKSNLLSLRVTINLISEINVLNLCFRRQKESLGNLVSFHEKREFHAAVWCCLGHLRTCAGILVARDLKLTRLNVSCRRWRLLYLIHLKCCKNQKYSKRESTAIWWNWLQTRCMRTRGKNCLVYLRLWDRSWLIANFPTHSNSV